MVPAVPVVALVGGVLAVVPLVVPAVVPAVLPGVDPAIEPLPIVAFARMNPPPVVEEPVVVEDAALPAELSCTQPVTVTVFLSLLWLVVVLGLWAINATDVAHAIAAVIHKVRFIYPPLVRGCKADTLSWRTRWACDASTCIDEFGFAADKMTASVSEESGRAWASRKQLIEQLDGRAVEKVSGDHRDRSRTPCSTIGSPTRVHCRKRRGDSALRRHASIFRGLQEAI